MTWPRLPADLSGNPLTRRRQELAAMGRRLIDLTVTNPTTVGLPGPSAAAMAALAAPDVARHDPTPRGSPAARAAVAAYYADHGAGVDPDRIFLTASTSEGYAHAMRLTAAPGETLLVPVPSYPLLHPLAALEGIVLRPYELHYDGRWWLDRESFEQALNGGAVRGVIVVQPNNPTGSVLDADELEFVGTRAEAAGAVLIADEVFLDFPAPGVRFATLAGQNDRPMLVLSGLSKAAGLPQMKLGWIAVNGAGSAAAALYEGLEWITDTFLSVGAPVQAALPGFLADRHPFLNAARRRIDANEARLDARLAGTPVSRRWRAGGWSCVLRLPAVLGDDAWALTLLEAGVVVHPGHFYDAAEPALLVLSLLTPEDEWAEGIERLLDTVGSS